MKVHANDSNYKLYGLQTIMISLQISEICILEDTCKQKYSMYHQCIGGTASNVIKLFHCCNQRLTRISTCQMNDARPSTNRAKQQIMKIRLLVIKKCSELKKKINNRTNGFFFKHRSRNYLSRLEYRAYGLWTTKCYKYGVSKAFALL